MAVPGEDALADEDRLPWLETVDEDDEEEPSFLRVVLLVLLGLAVLAAIVFAYYRSQQHFAGADGGASDGQLIAAPKGDYKVKPENPGGMKVEGQGDTVFATSQGQGPANGAIDLNAVPEKPVAGQHAKPAASAPARTSTTSVAQVPAANGTLTAAPAGRPAARAAASQGGGTALVQLGAFPSEAAANAAWTNMSKRFGYLAPLGKQVEAAQVGGGTTYRLRVNAGSAQAASTLCGKLKVAGEACFVPQN